MKCGEPMYKVKEMNESDGQKNRNKFREIVSYEDYIKNYTYRIASKFNGKGNIYTIEKYVRYGLSRGISVDEIHRYLSESYDEHQFIRHITHTIEKSTIKHEKLPLKLSDTEVKFLVMLGATKDTINSIRRGNTNKKMRANLYENLVNIRSLNWMDEETRIEFIDIICRRFGLDGYPPEKILYIKQETMINHMRSILAEHGRKSYTK